MAEKTWDMIYGAVMDLTKAVKDMRGEMNDMHAEMRDIRIQMNARFDCVEERLDKIEKDNTLLKLKQFDTENDIRILKERRI